MDWLTNPEIWVAFLTLTVLELVLGIDNIVFITILAGKLPQQQRQKARLIGLGIAMGTRVLLLLSLTWMMGLTAPLFTVFGQEISGRELILLGGGLFLIAKATHEIHDKLEGSDETSADRVAASFGSVIFQIVLIDMVFSLDSVITAIGMVDEVPVMIAAVITAVIFMMVAAGPISNFVDRHPTVKMLALSFLLLIGVSLMAEAFEQHVPKGYIYFAMAFSIFVEMLNMKIRKKPAEPVHLRHTPHP